MNMPWRGTTPEISAEVESMYETPLGAQNKVNVSQGYLLHLLKLAVTGLSNGSEAAIARYSEPYDITYDWLKDRLDAADTRFKNLNIMNVKDYGAKGDGITNDTDAINSLISSTTNGTVLFPPGEYIISKQGTRLLSYSGEQRGYGILVLNKSNIRLEFMAGAVIKMSVSDEEIFNGMWVEGCSDIEIINPHFQGLNKTTTRILEEGTGVSITQCANILVDGPVSKDMRGCARAYNSDHILIKDGFSQIYTNEHASAHFSFSVCTNSTIDGCTSYGATLDGDIFIYGGYARNCVISNCRAFSHVYGDVNKTVFYNEGQGIQIDSGGRDCKIIDCYAYGYYLGLGFKNASEGATISGNTVEKCKVGIQVYKGDGVSSPSPTNIVNIDKNTIIPNGGNGNTNPLVGNLLGPFGIMVNDCYGGSNVTGNMFYNSVDMINELNFIGVFVGISDNISNTSQGGILIQGNNFCFENRLGSWYGVNKHQAIFVTSQHLMINVSIEGNTFDLPYSGILTNVIEADHVQGLTICNNNFSDYNIIGKPVIKFSNCQRVNINANNFGYNHGLLEAYASQAISFSENMSAESIDITPTPATLFDNCQWINVNGNTQKAITDYNRDSFYYKDQNGSNWVSMQGNLLNLKNKTPEDYYSSVSTNFNFANNVIG